MPRPATSYFADPRPARSVLLAVSVVLALGLGTNATAAQPGPDRTAAPRRRRDRAGPARRRPGRRRAFYELARAGARVYAYGYFSTVGRYAGPGAALIVEDGAPDSPRTPTAVSRSRSRAGPVVGSSAATSPGSAATQPGGLAHVLDADTLGPVPRFHANTNTFGDLFLGAGAVWVARRT